MVPSQNRIVYLTSGSVFKHVAEFIIRPIIIIIILVNMLK